MSRIGGGVLVAIGLLMLLGFFNADVDASAPATLLALLLVAGLPLGLGTALLTGRLRGGRQRTERMAELERETLAAELLRLAGQRQGRLTIPEVMTDLALPADRAKQALDALMVEGLADIEVTDSGLLVYRFPDVQRLGDKHDSRDLLA